MEQTAHERWCIMCDRISAKKALWVNRYPDMYLLVCTKTGRYALGDPTNDGQGGYKDASDKFDAKYGSMYACGEPWREMLGVSLRAKDPTS